MTFRLNAMAGMLAILAAAGAQASAPSVEECFEGSDFIANAALARDGGMNREAFISRMENDFVLIRAYPPALRWFVKDDDDERFLRAAASEVYDRPRSPELHRADFLDACFNRSAA